MGRAFGATLTVFMALGLLGLPATVALIVLMAPVPWPVSVLARVPPVAAVFQVASVGLGLRQLRKEPAEL
jgi:hypothetical protein